MLPLPLPDHRLCLDRIEITPHAIILSLHAAAPVAPCPGCAQPARQVHSHYTRFAHDLAIQGRAAFLRLTARRFFCRTPGCPHRIFCEQFPALLARHAQATARLHETHRDIGMALGGQPGARLAKKLGMPTSPDTILRRVKQPSPAGAADQPARIVGVDDWAMRKGHTYGTIIIDLERSVVLELLPGRDGVELKAWLGRHPEVEVLSRDRWSAFAEAAAEAVPQARQVADRFHLLKNAREALERFLDRYAGRIAEAFATPAPGLAAPAAGPAAPAEVVPGPALAGPPQARPEGVGQPPAAAGQLTARQQQRLERYHEVRSGHTEGQSLRRIARELHLSKTTVLRHLRAGQCPDWRPGRTGGSHRAVAGRPVPRADRRLAGGREPQRGGVASAVAGRGPRARV